MSKHDNIDRETIAVNDAILSAITYEMRGSYFQEALPEMYGEGDHAPWGEAEVHAFVGAVGRRSDRIRALLRAGGFETEGTSVKVPMWKKQPPLNVTVNVNNPVPEALQKVKDDAEAYARRKLTDYGKEQQARMAEAREHNAGVAEYVAKGFTEALEGAIAEELGVELPQEGQRYTAPIGAPLHPNVPEGPVETADGRSRWEIPENPLIESNAWRDVQEHAKRQKALNDAAEAVDKIQQIEHVMDLPEDYKDAEVFTKIRRILKGLPADE